MEPSNSWPRWWRFPYLALFAAGAVANPEPFVFTGTGIIGRGMWLVGIGGTLTALIARRSTPVRALGYVLMVTACLFRAFVVLFAPGSLATANRQVGVWVYVTLACSALCLAVLTDLGKRR